jgi:hypothetical protein
MKLGPVFQGTLALGAALAVVGGAAIGLLNIVSPDMEILRRVEAGYRHVIFGFLFLTLFAVAAALLEALRRAATPLPPGEPPAPAARPAVLPAAAPPAPAKAGLESLYHEMKTYIDLEMWELALEKANLIVKNFPGTPQAELVSRNLNELRWKAEPKFVAHKEPLSADQERELREKGLAQMYQHVRTYMDLEMWELARQKALAILKNFPDAPEAAELMKVYEAIEKKAREAVAAEKPES